jgi:hypothetical protein
MSSILSNQFFLVYFIRTVFLLSFTVLTTTPRGRALGGGESEGLCKEEIGNQIRGIRKFLKHTIAVEAVHPSTFPMEWDIYFPFKHIGIAICIVDPRILSGL